MEQNPAEKAPNIQDSPDAANEEEWYRERSRLIAWFNNAFNAYADNVPPKKGPFSHHDDFSELEQTVLPKLHAAGFAEDRLIHYEQYHHLQRKGTSFKNSPKIDFPGRYAMKEFYRGIIEQYGGRIPTPEQEEWQIYRGYMARLAYQARQALEKHFGDTRERSRTFDDLINAYTKRLMQAGFRDERTRYAAYHQLIGSGIVYDGSVPYKDFPKEPEDLSVEGFYKDIIAKYDSDQQS